MPEAINYGTHAPATIDYGPHAPVKPPAQGFLSSLGQGLGLPQSFDEAGNMLKEGVRSALYPPAAIENAARIGTNVLQSQGEQFKKGWESLKKGDIPTALARGVYGAVPVAGPTMAKAAEQWSEGDRAGSVGSGVAAITQLAAPEFMSRALPAVSNAIGAVTGKIGTVARNPAVRGAALDLVPYGAKIKKLKNAVDAAKGALGQGTPVNVPRPPGSTPPPLPVTGPAPELLDQIAMGIGGRKFAKLDPAGQASVRTMAERVQGGAPASIPPPPGTELPEAPASALPPPRDYTGYRGKYKIDPEDYAHSRRAQKTVKWAEYLNNKGISVEDASKLDWAKHAKEAGLNVPQSSASVNQILVLLHDLKGGLKLPPQ